MIDFGLLVLYRNGFSRKVVRDRILRFGVGFLGDGRLWIFGVGMFRVRFRVMRLLAWIFGASFLVFCSVLEIFSLYCCTSQSNPAITTYNSITVHTHSSLTNSSQP